LQCIHRSPREEGRVGLAPIFTFSDKSSAPTGCSKVAGGSESDNNHFYQNNADHYTNRIGNHHYYAIYRASLDRSRFGNAHRSSSGGAGGDNHGQKPLVQLTVTQPTAEQQEGFSSL